MPIDHDELAHLAQLAHIRLDEREFEDVRGAISNVIDHISKLREVDTSGVQGAAWSPGATLLLRPDVPRPSWTSGEVLANAPRTEDGYFAVQALFE